MKSVSKAIIRDVDVQKTFALSGLLRFTRFFFRERYKRKFAVGKHHKVIADALDKVLRGEVKRLMINIAPRYSKTELAVKNFIAMGLALNPRSRFIHLSYSDDLARDNSTEVQAIMLEPMYQRLFCTQPTSNSSKKWSTPEGGGLYAVSSAGQVTGFGAGIVDNTDDEDATEIDNAIEFIGKSQGFGGAIIIDDPIKPDDALSATIRNKVNNKFDTTIRNRVNSRNTPIVIIMQRLHEDDLCGHLLKAEGDEWTVVSLPCITRDEKTGEEEALWPFKHTLKELRALRAKNPFVFDTQYLQDPKPQGGLMYPNGFKTYDIVPYHPHTIRKIYIDTADTGSDYLCAIAYDETPAYSYIIDIIYTQKPMEATETMVAEMVMKLSPSVVYIEGNNGGRGFARKVEEIVRTQGNGRTRFECFHQSANKQTRIFINSASVENTTIFPIGWELLFPQFHSAITGYRRVGRNDHDDAPDALTGTFERREQAIQLRDEEIENDIL